MSVDFILVFVIYIRKLYVECERMLALELDCEMWNVSCFLFDTYKEERKQLWATLFLLLDHEHYINQCDRPHTATIFTWIHRIIEIFQLPNELHSLSTRPTNRLMFSSRCAFEFELNEEKLHVKYSINNSQAVKRSERR